MHSNEKPIILVVTTLFLAFTLVYMIFFRIRDTSVDDSTIVSTGAFLSWEVWGSGTVNTDSLISSLLNDTWTLLSWSTFSWSLLTWSQSDRVSLQPGDSIVSSWSLSSWWAIVKPSTGSSSQTITPILDTTNDNSYRYKRIDTVSGATAWYNSVKIAEVLWLDVQVVFADTGNILYAYLGTGELTTLSPTIKRLQWNILAIDTQIDIVKNWLPWDRVRYINIPQLTFVRKNGIEQKVMVAMIVTIDDDQWLIQAPYDIYHGSKTRMVQIFQQLYK